MKTTETTEEVSSHGVEKRVERHKVKEARLCQKKTEGGLEKDLQICGEERESRKKPTMVMARNQMGNFSLYFCLGL